MSELITEIREAGLGFGSLILFALLFWQQMKLMEKFKETIDANTKATDALTARISEGSMIDQQVVAQLQACKIKQL